MASLAAVRYSQALFELGVEERKLDCFKDDLRMIDHVLNENVDLGKILKHPNVDKMERKQILEKVFLNIDPYISNFIKLLVDRNRFSLIQEIYKIYTRSYNVFNNIEVAYIESANALNEDEIQKLVSMLEKKTGKKVEYDLRVNPELLAGLRIKINGDVLDNTAAYQLNQMRDLVKKQSI